MMSSSIKHVRPLKNDDDRFGACKDLHTERCDGGMSIQALEAFLIDAFLVLAQHRFIVCLPPMVEQTQATK
jgi:hypothetical protein